MLTLSRVAIANAAILPSELYVIGLVLRV